MKKEKIKKETEKLQKEAENSFNGEIDDADAESASGGVYSRPVIKPNQTEVV